MSETEAKSEQSFLSKLRQRSAIIFTIGLAISVASFVENLHMGKAAIAFAVDELSKIQGWEGFVRAAAAIFHGALEWWRGVLRDLLSFLPFEVPLWLHDPISLIFFGVSRAWSQVTYEIGRLRRPSRRSMSDEHRETLMRARRLSLPDQIAARLGIVFLGFLLPMALLSLADRRFSATQQGAAFDRNIELVYVYIAIPFLLAIFAAFWVGRRNEKKVREALQELDGMERSE